VSIIVDVILAVLLIMAIGYGMSLNRKIVALRDDQGKLEKLATSFYDATTRAEASVANLRSAAEESSRLLNEGVGETGEICEDLKYLIERGETIADELELKVRNAERNYEDGSDKPRFQNERFENVRRDIDMSEAEVLSQALGERVLNEQSDNLGNDGTPRLLNGIRDEKDHEKSVAKTDAEKELIKALQAVR
tara:strand:- start:189 stop:767 length:579 start_codon:yes stop_codon:yes gene_type:complete